MPPTRQQICQTSSRKLAAAIPTLGQTRAVLGFDGFVDEIIGVVDKRHDAASYASIQTIASFQEKIAAAIGQSCNYELIVKQVKLGGSGPITANALATCGLAVTYIGNLGHPDIHPAFHDFQKRATLISVGNPGHTDALEFADGKLMLGKLEPLSEVNWDNLLSRVGLSRLKSLLSDARLIGMMNWTMLPHMSRIWAKLLDEVIPNIERHSRKLFIDLSDPEKRLADDIRDAMRLLGRFQDRVDVILGLNLKESVEIAEVLGLPPMDDPEAAMEDNARAIREKLGLSCVVIHPRRGAAAATANGSAKFAGPFVQFPKISTGAGDHFNAGFSLGQVLQMDLDECLCMGVATSGYYVRTATSPTALELSKFIAELPPPQVV